MINSLLQGYGKHGDPFIELPSVDSTNIYAMQQVHARLAKHGTAYFAHEQNQGKGQRERHWAARKLRISDTNRCL